MKRTRVSASAAKSSAAAADGVPKAVQLPPPLVEYCQTPLAPSAAVTAMPCTAPGSGSLTMPAISVETRSPLPVWFS